VLNKTKKKAVKNTDIKGIYPPYISKGESIQKNQGTVTRVTKVRQSLINRTTKKEKP